VGPVMAKFLSSGTQRNRTFDCLTWMVFEVARRVEEGMDSVPDNLFDHASMSDDDGSHSLEIDVEIL
jgi:hypothetical protein